MFICSVEKSEESRRLWIYEHKPLFPVQYAVPCHAIHAASSTLGDQLPLHAVPLPFELIDIRLNSVQPPSSDRCVLRSWTTAVLLVVHTFQQRKLKHVAKCQYASQLGIFVDDDEAVYA